MIVTALFAQAVLVLILFFIFTNGMHDIGNIIGTMVSSGAMKPKRALLLAVFFDFIGPLLGGTMVANAMASLIRVDTIVSKLGRPAVLLVLAAALCGAILWNLFLWWRRLPSSSTHAFFGGLIGAALAATHSTASIEWGFSGFDPLHVRGFAGITAALFFSPMLGFAAGYLMVKFVRFFLRWASPRAALSLKRGQVATSALLAFSHGANAAQKGMGIMALALLSGGFITHYHVPFWIRIACGTALVLGDVLGGWGIVKTVGQGIFRMRPEFGFESQAASALIVLGNSITGGPVSTTHVISTSIMGVGTAVRKKAVRWQRVFDILLSWLLTVPAAMILGAAAYYALSPLGAMLK